ncbi:MAG: branched-chain amino acid ABC transporter permease [Gammaproteobacteria bacterium]
MRLGPRSAFILFLLLLTGAIIATQWFGNRYLETLLALSLINVMLAVSLTLTNGFTGLLSLGHPAFMTLGAYVAVILTYPQARKSFMLPELPAWLAQTDWTLPPALLAGGLAAGLLALIVGAAVLRLKTHYLAVATLGLIIIVQGFANNLDGITRGGRGITGIPRLADVWLIGALVLLVIAIAWRLKHSSLGRAMLAVRENELAASCFGISGFRLQLIAFVLGAIVAGMAGALTPHVVAVLTPKSFGLILAFNLVAMVVVGGQGSIVGAIIAALVISSLSEFLKPLEESLELYGLVQIIIALLLIMVLLWRPRGLFGLREPCIKTVPPQ